MKRIIIKIMQIDIKEFEKCKLGKEFKANFISYPGPKPPVGMPKWFKAWSEEIYEKKQPQWFKEWSEKIYEKNQRTLETKIDEHGKRLDKIETTLAKHGEAINGVETKLADIVRLNKLKY